MEIVLAAFVLTMLTGFVVLLAILRVGIWRQERAGSLACRPPGLCAAITRRVCGLYANFPEEAVPAARSRRADIESQLVAGDSESAVS